MARIVLAAAADADSAAILAYLETRAGLAIAEKYAALFHKLYERLAVHPDHGPRRTRLGEGVRIGVATPYVVIYRHIEGDETVTILRIVHGHRKVTGKLLSREMS